MAVPPGPVNDKVEALAAGMRTVKRCLKAIEAEGKVFESCFTIDTLVNKQEESTGHKWSCRQVGRTAGAKCKVFVDRRGALHAKKCTATSGITPKSDHRQGWQDARFSIQAQRWRRKGC